MICSLISPSDRYEKRHRNLAAHVSPAFRVQIGDVVTVGAWIDVQIFTELGLNRLNVRSMPTAVEDCSIQCVARGEEQSCDERIRKVLICGSVSCVYCPHMHHAHISSAYA